MKVLEVNTNNVLHKANLYFEIICVDDRVLIPASLRHIVFLLLRV